MKRRADRRRPRRAAAGFTLIEVVVAMAIFALLGVIAYSGFAGLSHQREQAEAATQRLTRLQLAVRLLSQDLLELNPRPVRDPLGDILLPALLADERREYSVELTRAGWGNPAGLPRGTLQRVAYRLEDDVLYRSYWPVLDRTLGNEPIERALIEGVRRIELRYLDRSGQWQGQWPPRDMDGLQGLRARPIAVELRLELEPWGEIVRLIELGT